ncbi:hypothetical protein HanXRQr2_Chr06g0265371 [Helianthus annuus]|uniref:Uncharacterized protein n=1 Tax=Helianthus annuus TaxID=4232 RepID=A0A9K3IU12_HELAN|nr:hypothetical protein HanXRQr2_Chr06g0265371 [Helianthus annuus]
MIPLKCINGRWYSTTISDHDEEQEASDTTMFNGGLDCRGPRPTLDGVGARDADSSGTRGI